MDLPILSYGIYKMAFNLWKQKKSKRKPKPTAGPACYRQRGMLPRAAGSASTAHLACTARGGLPPTRARWRGGPTIQRQRAGEAEATAKLTTGEPACEAEAILMLSAPWQTEGCATVALGVAGGTLGRSRWPARFRWRCAGDGEPPPPRLSLAGASRGHQRAKGGKR